MSRSKPTEAEIIDRDEARNYLRSILPPGSTVLVNQRHVSRSGMMRHLSLGAIIDGEYRGITWTVYRAMIGADSGITDRGELKVGGCGMDMHFHTVYSLSKTIHNDGYALKHRTI